MKEVQGSSEEVRGQRKTQAVPDDMGKALAERKSTGLEIRREVQKGNRPFYYQAITVLPVKPA
jgi:hypothetical protein